VKITTTQADGRATLRIEGDLRIASVADAKREHVAGLAACGAIQLDLSEIGQCDTAGIQLLLMTCASARANGKEFELIGPTASFRAALGRVGIPVECFEVRAAPDMAGTITTADKAACIR
jgi:anti-sigma B factor antagonist